MPRAELLPEKKDSIIKIRNTWHWLQDQVTGTNSQGLEEMSSECGGRGERQMNQILSEQLRKHLPIVMSEEIGCDQGLKAEC